MDPRDVAAPHRTIRPRWSRSCCKDGRTLLRLDHGGARRLRGSGAGRGGRGEVRRAGRPARSARIGPATWSGRGAGRDAQGRAGPDRLAGAGFVKGGCESMDESRAQQAEVAALLGVIERMAGDLALAEEPARFIAALEAGRPPTAGDRRDRLDPRGARGRDPRRQDLPGRGHPGVSRADRAPRRGPPCLHHGGPRRGARDRPPARGRAGRGALARAAPRRAARLQGPVLHPRAADLVRHADGGVLPGRAGLHGGGAARGRGRGHAGQAQHDRAGDGALRRQRPPRPRPESVAGRALHRGLVERLRGRGGGRASRWAPSGPIPAGPSACPRRPAASSGSSRPTGA